MIGELIGHHRILAQIGQGGMGTVYQAEDTRLGRKVAIKILNPSLLVQGGIELERFQSEAKVQASLNHANVVTLFAFEPYQDSYCMIMEYVEGRTLADLIRSTGPLPSHVVVMIAKQVLDGLAAAHRQGVVHRDLKPSNIMLTAQGTAKVMDFGIAKVDGGKSLTATGALVGTVSYMSPEQVRGEPLDARSDLYSFGIILFELLTGRVPFKEESDFSVMIHHVQTPPPPLTQLLPDIPSELEDLVLRCLHKQPAERFQSAAEIRAVLESYEERERALGRAELYTRGVLAQWLAAPARAPSAATASAILPAPSIGAQGGPPQQAAALFGPDPSGARSIPSGPAPATPTPTRGKGVLIAAVAVMILAAGTALTYFVMNRPAAFQFAVKSGEPAAPQAQASAALTVPETAPAATGQPPAQSTPQVSANAMAQAPASPPVAGTASALTVPAVEKYAAPARKVPARPVRADPPAAGAAAPKSTTAAGQTAAQVDPVQTQSAGGFLIFVDLDPSSERLPLAAAQSRVAEILREAGCQVVSSGIVSTNVRAALDRNDLAAVRSQGVGYVVLGTAHASLEPQTAYGSTYYVGQATMAFELVRMSDGKIAATGSSDARSKGSANAQASLNNALMTATSDAARELMRNFKQ